MASATLLHDMDPAFLTENEVNYELAVRNVEGLDGLRSKTAKLRTFLGKEKTGELELPTGAPTDQKSEFNYCVHKIKKIKVDVDTAIEKRNYFDLDTSMSRLKHYHSRINRLTEISESDLESINNLLFQIFESAKKRKPNEGNKKSTESQQTLLDVTVEEARTSDLERNSNGGEPVVGSDSALGVVSVPSNTNDQQTVVVSDNNQNNMIDFGIPPAINIVTDSGLQNPVQRISNNSFSIPMDQSSLNNLNQHMENMNLGNRMDAGRPNPIEGIRNFDMHRQLRAAREQAPPQNVINFDGIRPRHVGDQQRVVGVGNHPGFNGGRPGFVDNQQCFVNDQRDFIDNRSGFVNSETAFVGNNPVFGRNPAPQQQLLDYPPIQPNLFQNQMGYHKSPVHNWNFKFSGDGLGLSLSDFFAEVAIYARSDNVNEAQLFTSAIYLFSGNARTWYRSNAQRFRNWAELVNGLRNEYLPANYDFLVREEITARVQKTDESFSTFMTDMNLLFQKVYPPLDQAYQLYIIKRNMLPQYSFQLSTVIINSVDQLVALCRQMDEARLLDQRRRQGPVAGNLMEPSRFPMPVRETRRVSLIENQQNNREYNSTGMNRNRGEINRNTQEGNRRQRNTCWNCDQVGHRHYDCRNGNRRLFCWFCGRRNVTVQNCPQNHALNRSFGGEVENQRIPENDEAEQH